MCIFALDMCRGLYIILLSLLFLPVISCRNNNSHKEGLELADSLYEVVSAERYKSVARFDSAARNLLALNHSNEYNAVARNALAYVSMMKMDYTRARDIYLAVIDEARCEIERLVADVGMMTLCYRVSRNRDFFDYRTSALRRIRRISEEEEFLSATDCERFECAKIEFNIVSICYFSNIGLVEELESAAYYLKQDLEQCNEVALRIYARMMLTGMGKVPSESLETYSIGMKLATDRGLLWLSGNYKLLSAIAMRGAASQESAKDSIAIGEQALQTALAAVKDFSNYGDKYMKIEALAVAASCNTWLGRYYESLSLLDEAIADINSYNRKENNLSLDTFAYIDDLEQLQESNSMNIYECMLSVRREASCAYAGLGNKELSDINREAYLDLLRTTRMNKKMESRIDEAMDNAVRLYWWALLALLALLGVTFFLYFMNKRWRSYNKQNSHNLRRILDLSRKLMSSLPLEMNSEEEVYNAVCNILSDEYANFLSPSRFSFVTPFEPCSDYPFVYTLPFVETKRPKALYIASEKEISCDKMSVVEMSLPYISVAVEEGLRIANISDEQLRLEEQRMSHFIYLTEHKRENLLKRVSVSIVNGMRPYMDRLLNELRLLARSQDCETINRRLYYVAELAEKLGDYNIILERWIKMRRGELNLHIECFSIREIFEIIAKSENIFDARGIKLNVKMSDAVVRADRALTLFMINTLVDNAGKFTPSGGCITVEAEETSQFVEIAIVDTGVGLSVDDIERVLNEKVYDASLIGSGDGTVSRNKGSGFGLMNCKGIIEKYKGYDEIFSVCTLDIKSEKGKGSRFSFCLPRGIVRCILFLLTLFIPSLAICDSTLLDRAGECADSVFHSNVSGNYEKAFFYASQGLNVLNEYYRAEVGGVDTLALVSGKASELQWWREELFAPELKESIFFNILDIRNELAVAALAMQRWDDYRYNNAIYASLYRLVHEDKGLEEHYEKTKQIVNYRQAAIALLLFFILLILIAYVVSYVRHRVIERINSHMLLDLNRRLLAVSGSDEWLSVDELARRISLEIYKSLHEAMCVERVSVLLKNGNSASVVVSYPQEDVTDIYMNRVLESGASYLSSDSLLHVVPLSVVSAGETIIIGSVELLSERPMSENEMLNIELVVRYAASVAYHSIVRLAENYRSLAEVEEETERVKFEENRLHVQNLVMDNCLSMIKHETIYYPGRIALLVEQTIAASDNVALREEKIADMRELMEYYNSIFVILNNCASKQLDEIGFRLVKVQLGDIFEETARLLARKARKRDIDVSLHYDSVDMVVAADKDMLKFLFEMLVDAVLQVRDGGELLLRAVDCGDMVRIEMCDKRRKLSRDVLLEIFTPSKNNLSPDGGLQGMEYLVVKEIVRLHEDYLQTHSCRVEARDSDEGVVIMFTLPKNSTL